MWHVGGEVEKYAQRVVRLQLLKNMAQSQRDTVHLHKHISRHYSYNTRSQQQTPVTSPTPFGCISGPSPVRQSLLPRHVRWLAASSPNDIPCPGPDNILYPHLLPQNDGKVLSSCLAGEEARRIRVESLVNDTLPVLLLLRLPQRSLRVIRVRARGDQRAVAQNI